MSTTELRTRLGELDAYIAHNQALVDSHKKQRRKITRQLDILIYPILTLPPEIISFNLRWRAIALGDSSLWAMLCFDFDCKRLQFRTPAQIENFLESWARRAGSRPLSLTFSGDMVSRLGKARSTALMIRLAPRVKQLQLCLPNGLWKSYGPASSSLIRWDLLEKLTIDSKHGFPSTRVSHAFALAPKLRELELDGLRVSPFSVAVSWKHLATFNGQLSCLEECLQVLREAENLLECSIFIPGDDLDVDEEAPYRKHHSCSHPNLRELTLFGLEFGLPIIFNLLSLLMLPALQTFRLNESPRDHEIFAAFLHRHSSHLRELEMEYFPVKLFPGLPVLTKLTLLPRWERDPTFASNFFGLLQDPEVPFLPSIQHISLPLFRSRKGSDFEIIAGALLSRWNRHHCGEHKGVTKICSFSLDIGLSKEEIIDDLEEVLRPLTDLQVKGVDILLTVGTYSAMRDDEI
ncbi:hypothetical protein C8R44DRAFT_872472 [Mycena epipterygia]|nr:hypothetical protein C8R44DRAFT_872472 [Mycena epipterygia]